MKRKIMAITMLIFLLIFASACGSSSSDKKDAPKKNNVQQNETNKTSSNDTVNNNVSSQQDNSRAVTEEEAVNIASKYVGTLPKGYHLDFEYVDSRDNKEYYVIHYYESVIDDEATGLGHEATYNWFYVDKNNGDFYRLDVATDKLVSIKISSN